MVKALFFDVDGTLAESRQPVGDEIVGILLVLAKYYRLGFVSGSNYELMAKQIIFPLFNRVSHDEELEVDAITTSGGARRVVRKRPRYPVFLTEMIYFKELTSWQKVRIYAAIHRLIRKNDILPYTSFDDMVDDRGSQINFSLTGKSAPLEIKKQYDPDMKKRKDFIKQLELESLWDIRPVIGGTTSIDFLQENVTKGNAIQELMTERGWSFHDVIYYGDKLVAGGNDESVIGKCETKQVANPAETLKELQKHWEKYISKNYQLSQ